MAPTQRRVGAQTSATRTTILDCVEQLMLEDGYPGVTYRAVAKRAEVTPGLVQYYFPTLDTIFVAAIERRFDENIRRLSDALAARPDDVLRVIWEFGREEATGALMTEFMALGNHRETVGAAIARVAERMREIELEALAARFDNNASGEHLTPGALVVLLAGIPKLLNLEKGVGVTTAHDEVIAAVESYVDSVEADRTKR
ncbi:TetR/AcrR family transcriptional regulator [Gordonia sp. CPCC 206044]|uniref:TetR/AcrR family transcriptional regulator n=1 Tax=Gordonia sp. CPCC 206044 TaxID=3140793 RepID=UPI003AF3E715